MDFTMWLKYEALPYLGETSPSLIITHTLLVHFFVECVDSGAGLSHSFDTWKDIFFFFGSLISIDYRSITLSILYCQLIEDARARCCATSCDTRNSERDALRTNACCERRMEFVDTSGEHLP